MNKSILMLAGALSCLGVVATSTPAAALSDGEMRQLQELAQKRAVEVLGPATSDYTHLSITKQVGDHPQDRRGFICKTIKVKHDKMAQGTFTRRHCEPTI